MKILILGSNGFIGRKVSEILSAEHDIHGASKEGGKDQNLYLDLLDKPTIAKVLNDVRPEVIINCAGIVDNSEKAMLNPVFSSNLLSEVLANGLPLKQVIISGSAAEYGTVDRKDIPVSEATPLNATQGYGLSKLKETSLALEFRHKHGLPVIIARIFNPIGKGMHPRFLIPSLIEQVQEIKNGERAVIEVSRLDSRRDYINVSDIALAIKCLVENQPKQDVYNIGSGKTTSNKDLVELILKDSKLSKRPDIIETSKDKESLVAIQADISRIKNEFGWKPASTIEETVKETIDDAR